MCTRHRRPSVSTCECYTSWHFVQTRRLFSTGIVGGKSEKKKKLAVIKDREVVVKRDDSLHGGQLENAAFGFNKQGW